MPAHRSAVLWQADMAISKRDSFNSLGMADSRTFMGQESRYSKEKTFAHAFYEGLLSVTFIIDLLKLSH